MAGKGERLAASFGAALDGRALERLRRARRQRGEAALDSLREALMYVTSPDTLDEIIERARELTAESESGVREKAAGFVREAESVRETTRRQA
jgi:hypothetical protein